MCKCVENITKEMTGRMVGKGTTKRKVISATLIQQGIMFSSKITAPTFSEIECTLEGQKKPFIQTIIHSFCPFCGEKIKKQ